MHTNIEQIYDTLFRQIETKTLVNQIYEWQVISLIVNDQFDCYTNRRTGVSNYISNSII